MTLSIMDWATGEKRDATQKDIDDLQGLHMSLAVRNAKLPDPSEASTEMNFRLSIYPNPMRGDGVFVAEDREIEPYQGVKGLGGQTLYPATPQTGYRIGTQLPHKFACEIVRRWNLHSTQGE